MTPELCTGTRLETLRRGALVALFGALFGLAGGCAALPTVTFTSEEAGVTDGSVPRDSSVAGDSASPVSDGGGHDSSIDGAAPFDAGNDAGDVDAGNPLACLPAGAPAGAACCSATMPCAGMACSHCNDCSQLDPACTPTQYCCATVNGAGKYKGVSCSANGAKCP